MVRWYNSAMLVAMISIQITRGELSPTVIVALVAIVVVGVLAVVVSLRIARRLRAIGDEGQPLDDDETPHHEALPRNDE